MQDKIGFFYNITLPDKNIIGNENEGVVQMLKEKVNCSVRIQYIYKKKKNSNINSKN